MIHHLHALTHACTHSLTHSLFAHSLAHSLVHSINHLFIDSFTHLSTLIIHSFIQVLFKLKLCGEADLADLAYILHVLNLNSSQFLYMCIVAGCDFLPNIKGIGIHRASQVVTRKDFLNEIGNLRNAPSDYCNGFKQARAVFKHQAIYDLDSKSVRPLTAWESGEDEAQFSFACGEYPLINN